MATVIRLRRGGRTHAPYYRIVVQDARNRPRGRVIDQIGVYQPCARPEPRSEVDVAKALRWLYVGAKPSDTARSVLSASGVMAAFHAGKKPDEFGEEQPVEVRGDAPVEVGRIEPAPAAAAAEQAAPDADDTPAPAEADSAEEQPAPVAEAVEPATADAGAPGDEAAQEQS